ncbi:MAG: hypothetical protein SFW07_02930 [Gammaproteobacteria bacterium]|nr:hypothetical protein [Gammaproteobacteria bacterium]
MNWNRMFENQDPHHWTLNSDTGTQLHSPFRKPGVFRSPLSPINLNAQANPFQRTPSPKRVRPPVELPLPEPEKKSRELSIDDLCRRSANEQKKKELQRIVDDLSINIDHLKNGASSYSDPKEIKEQRDLSLQLKYILKPALTAALRDNKQRFRDYLIGRALFLDTISTNEIFEILENYCGNFPRKPEIDSFDHIWHIQRNSRIFTLFLQFDLDSRDIYDDANWAIHPNIAEAHEFLFGKKEVEFPVALLEKNYPSVGFFTAQNTEQFITEFNQIRDALRSGIVEFAAHPQKLMPGVIEDFILDQVKALIALRDKIKPGKKEANDLIEAVNSYTNFVCTLREEAKQLPTEKAFELANTLLNKPVATI